MAEQTVHDIVRELGAERIASALDVTIHSIRAAKRERAFPARWYGPLKDMAEREGVSVPMDAFNWLDPDKKSVSEQRGAASRTPQGPDGAQKEGAA